MRQAASPGCVARYAARSHVTGRARITVASSDLDRSRIGYAAARRNIATLFRITGNRAGSQNRYPFAEQAISWPIFFRHYLPPDSQSDLNRPGSLLTHSRTSPNLQGDCHA